MAIRIGITGGIGSGKSMVSRLLEVMGVPVYISDVEARRLTATDAVIRDGLTALLGDAVYAGGMLDKAFLADYLFTSADHAARVNAIIHPQVRNDFRKWVDAHADFSLVGMESAILLEAGFASEVDYVVMVSAPLEIRVERAMKRDAASREKIEARVRSQMDDAEKRLSADFVILNDGETPLIPQVLQLITSLSKNIDYLCSSEKTDVGA